MSRSYSDQHPYGYSTRGGWDIDTSDRTQRTCDGGESSLKKLSMFRVMTMTATKTMMTSK